MSSGGVAGGLLVLLVYKTYESKYRENADVAAFKPLNNYFVLDSFKTLSVYYMYHTFSNYFVMSSF